MRSGAASRAEHLDTTVLAEERALCRDFNFRNGRYVDAPIFAVGDVDPGRPFHEDIVGAISASGTTVAFPGSGKLIALNWGDPVEFENIGHALPAVEIGAVNAYGGRITITRTLFMTETTGGACMNCLSYRCAQL